MIVSIDITTILSYLKSTSNLALSCREFAWRVKSNGFPIRTSEADLCLENLFFYKSLDYPGVDKWLSKQVFKATEDGDHDRLHLLLEHKADTEAKDCNEETVLVLAARWRPECLQVLLEHKADIEATDNWGRTALMLAAYHGVTDCLQVLLNHKASVEAKNNVGSTALISASIEGDVECLKLLLRGGANIEAKNDSGFTALSLATMYGQRDFLKALLENGAKVDPETREWYPQYADLWENSTL